MLSGLDNKKTSASDMEVHTKSHSNERPFYCTICNKRFITQKTLQNHGAVHSNQERFFCSFCNKSYKYKRDLNRHMKAHPEFSFSCSFCKQQLNDGRSLHHHERKCKMNNREKFKENREIVAAKETGVQKELKVHSRGNEEGKDEEIVFFAGRPFPLEISRKSWSSKFYLSEKNEQQDLEVKDDEQVVKTGDNEQYFDPSPGWKLWKSWDDWDRIAKFSKTSEDEFDFDSSPGWKQWKKWHIWDSWKNNMPEEMT